MPKATAATNDNEEVVEELDHSQEEAPEELHEEVEQEEEHEQEEETQEDDSTEEEEEVEEEQKPPSRREQLRINQLLAKYGPPEDRRQAPPQQRGIDYRNLIDADEDVYSQLENASKEYGNNQFQQGLREADKVKFETRLEIDNSRVEATHPELNKNSDEFKPSVANAINTMYLSAVGYDPKTGYVQNPNLRYADYVDAMFELVDEAASRKTQATRNNVVKQAARTGIRPSGTTAKTTVDLTKDPSQMSDKELDAALAKMGLSPKKR